MFTIFNSILKSIHQKCLCRRSDIEARELGISPPSLLNAVRACRGLQVEPPGDALPRPVGPAGAVRGPAVVVDARVSGPKCSVHGSGRNYGNIFSCVNV